MTTNEMTEMLSDEIIKVFKRDLKKSERCRRLQRHETITVDGTEVHSWKELSLLKISEFMREVLPNADIELVIDGNNSQIVAKLDDNELEKLNSSLYLFLKKARLTT